jgi:hypothetical protein
VVIPHRFSVWRSGSGDSPGITPSAKVALTSVRSAYRCCAGRSATIGRHRVLEGIDSSRGLAHFAWSLQAADRQTSCRRIHQRTAASGTATVTRARTMPPDSSWLQIRAFPVTSWRRWAYEVRRRW